MTYEELWLKATYLLDHNKITLGEFEEMIKPLKKEIPQDCENCADYSPKFDTCQRKEYECTFKPKFMPKTEPQTNADQHIQHVESVEQTEAWQEPFETDCSWK